MSKNNVIPSQRARWRGNPPVEWNWGTMTSRCFARKSVGFQVQVGTQYLSSGRLPPITGHSEAVRTLPWESPR